MAENGVTPRNEPPADEPTRHDPSEALSIVRADVALRHAEFMRLYLRGPIGVRYNGIECARRMGYSGDNDALKVRASEVLHHPRNMLKIQRALDRDDAGLERVIHELACIGFARQADYATWDAAGVAVKSSTDLDDDQLAAVVGVEEYMLGERKAVRVKLADKVAALGLLARLNKFANPIDEDESSQRPFTLILGAQHVTVQQNGHPTNGAAPTTGDAGETR